MLDRQAELAHRLAPTMRPLMHQRGIVEPLCAPFQLGLGLEECAGAQPASDATLQARSVQDADDGEERLVEPFSLLPSLLLLLLFQLEVPLLFAALALVSFSRLVRSSSLLAIWSQCFEGG